MKKSVNRWIRAANYAHKIVPEADHFAKHRADSRRRNDAKVDAYVEGFTEKEWEIINGDRIGTARRPTVTRLIHKAEDYGRFDIADKLRDMYEYLYEDTDLIERISKEEALGILDSLTPTDFDEDESE